MALKDLSPRQMVQITAAWLDPERESAAPRVAEAVRPAHRRYRGRARRHLAVAPQAEEGE